MDKPTAYDGSPGKLANFKFKVTQYVQVVGLKDGIKQQQLASSLLTGKALTWWRAQCETAKKGLYPVELLSTMNVSEFWKELQVAFRDVDHENRLRSKLSTLRQTGSVQQYIALFRSIVVDLGDEAPNDNDQLYTFVSGLKSAVQLQVRLQRPKSLQEAEELAETTDSALYYTGQRGNQYTRSGKCGKQSGG